MAHLEPGTLLLDRFALTEQLRDGLWQAHDRELDTHTLVEVYDTAQTDIDSLQHLVRKFREVEHANLVRVFDLHHDQTTAVIPLSGSHAITLATHLKRTGPLPYREVLDKIRPLIEALRTLHDHGVIHSGIHPDNIVTDESGTWQLLPGRPARESMSTEMQQLGQLFADALLGGEELEPGKEPNNLPDKLFGGRTIPALLNQLVTDMRSSSSDQRPAGMGESLKRLDQIERLAEPAPPPPQPTTSKDTPPAPPPVIAVHPKKTQKIQAAFFFVGFLFFLFAIGAVGLWWYYQAEEKKADTEEQRRLREAGNPVPVEQTQTNPPDASTTSNPTAEAAADAELVKQAILKAEAEEALDKYMAAKQSAEDVGAHKWATMEFAKAFRAAAVADQAFIDKAYKKSAEHYLRSATQLESIASGKDAALEQLLEDGAVQLLEGTTATATKVYETALSIDPENPEAREGLRRAKLLDKRNALLTSAAEHEENKRYAFAYTDFEEAVKIDPDSERAVDGLTRLKGLISEDRFQAMMSAGLTAFHKGDFERATNTLNDAKIFQPGRPEVDDALEMVAEGIRLRKIEQHKEQAEAFEQNEEWQEARKAYLAVQEIDPNIQFANEGRERAEARITLMTKLAHYNGNNALLLKPAGLQDAQLVASQAQDILNKGPKLQKAYDLLNHAVARASTKIKVTLLSDNETAVDVYKVGRFGAFKNHTLELLPGTYTIVGHRTGYRDVRTQLRLEPGQTEVNLSVICTERF